MDDKSVIRRVLSEMKQLGNEIRSSGTKIMSGTCDCGRFHTYTAMEISVQQTVLMRCDCGRIVRLR